MAKQQYKKGVTPVGEALFAHVLKTEIIKKDGQEKDTGKFSIMLKLKDADKKALLNSINEEWENFKNTLTGKKFKYDISNGIKEYKEEEYFKFSMNETIRLKSGETLHRTVPVFDTSCKDISKTLTSLGNGSKVRIAYDLVPFYMSDKNYGISLRLTGIQIIDLVEFNGSTAESLGFGKTEGYVADEAEDENNVFADGTEDDNDEGDF